MGTTPKRSAGQRSNSSQNVRKTFYGQAVKLTGFTEERCREILVDKFGETFDPTKIDEYLKLLKEHAEDVRLKAALDAKRQQLRNRLIPTPEPIPCGITGCHGFRVRGLPYPWVCSEGGLRHYLAVTGSAHTGLTPDEFLAKMEALAIKKEVRNEVQAVWLSENLPSETAALALEVPHD